MNAVGTRGREVRGVVLPAGGADLLLPNAAVAEVISYQEPTPYSSGPAWLLGTVNWRGCFVPLVSVAVADGQVHASLPGRRARLAICYLPSGNSALPFVALLTTGAPRLARFDAQGLVPAPERPENPFVLHALVYAERPAWIPDMDAVERALLENSRAS